MKLYDNDSFRETFMKRVYELLADDPDNYRANEIIDLFDNAPEFNPPNEPLPVLVNDEPDREYIDYICPRCKNTISQRRRGQRMETVYQCKYHDNCGQHVDWENPHRLTAARRREKYE